MEDNIKITNQEICNQIDDVLIKNGLKEKSIFNFNNSYTKEELKLVNTIYLECSDSIEDLLKLPNLKVLKIKSMNQDTVVEDNPFLVNHIDDFSTISYLTSLEELTIVNDPNLKSLVLSPLKNLKKLKLCNNRNLEFVLGINELKHLNNILIYGNKKEPKIDPSLYLENTKDAKKNYLDITMYYDFLKKDPKFREKYIEATNNYSTNLEFVEKVGIYNYYVPFRPTATVDLYDKAFELLKSRFAVKFNIGTREKMKSLYDYARKKVEYDYDTLKHRDTNSLQEATEDEQKSYRMSFPNTSYKALVEKRTVCEGYANMLHLLYHMIGVESRVIYCSSHEDFINGLNHAALRVCYHDEDLYIDSDPNWNKEKENFLVSKEEFEKTHVLSLTEKEVKGEENANKRYFK